MLLRAVGRIPTLPRERALRLLALIEQGADEIAAAADPPSNFTRLRYVQRLKSELSVRRPPTLNEAEGCNQGILSCH